MAERIAILGCGVIGTSIGLALRHADRHTRAYRLFGFDPLPGRSSEAVALGAFDEAADSVEAAVREAGVVVVAVPAGAVAAVARHASAAAPGGAVFTDVASIKGAIAAELGDRLPGGQWFVGGHPMAGSERSGPGAADPFLFQNAVWVLTPGSGVPETTVGLVESLVRTVGAKPVRLPPDQHDVGTATASHVPHLLASSLALAAARLAQQGAPVLTLAATGFRDATRLAMGNEQVWEPILTLNREAIRRALQTFKAALGEFEEALDRPDGRALAGLLAEAREHRRRLRVASKGYGHALWDLVVKLEDRPGAIHSVTGPLARCGLNVADIEILRVREGEAGTLRLGFSSEEDLQRALAVLGSEGFAAWPR